MRTRMWLGIITLLAIPTVCFADGPITKNPIPEPIVKRGIAVEIKDLARLPDTRGLRPPDQDVSPAAWARVSFVRDLPDGRRFANDSRGLLYRIDSNNQPHVYADVGAIISAAVYHRLAERLHRLRFHPEFATNGLLYTVHAENAPGNPKTPDFIPPGYALKDVTYHNVITEWRATNPAANTFAGTRRELLRVAHVVAEPDPSAWARWNSIRRRSPAIPTTACSTPAAAISASATAAGRTRTIPRRRSGSIRSSAPSCASIREARR